MSAAAPVPAREPAAVRAPHRESSSPRSTAPVDPLAAAPLARPGFVLQRCACGGGCPACRAKATGLPSLPIHPADDAYEREADRVADAVLRGGSASVRSATPVLPSISRLQRCSCGRGQYLEGAAPEPAEEEDAHVQRCASGAGGAGIAPPIVHEVLRSPGQPLDAAARAFLEPRFGRGFGDVRVHTSARAAESARAVGAVAYTVGRDVVFGAGAYRPASVEGRLLLAHELTHVVQQCGEGAGSSPASGAGTGRLQAKLCVKGSAASDLLDRFQGCSTNMTDLRMGDPCPGCTGFSEVHRDSGPTGSDTFTDKVNEVLNGASTLCIDAVRGDANSIEDNFANRNIDVSDKDMFPNGPPAGKPSATTRCQHYIHPLAEFWHAAVTGAGFPASHPVGEAAENRYRADKGQPGTITNQVLTSPGRAVISYSNGARTDVTFVGGNVTAVGFTEPAATPAPRGP